MDTAGLHDPYWYEGSVGLLSAIDMLNPDNEIESITFQKTGAKGLDDVVVVHRSGRTIYMQIKHTRADNTLTFGDMVSQPGAEDGRAEGTSLLAHTAEAWRKARSECDFAEARIYTNRTIGNRPYRRRPALEAFWQSLCEQIQDVDELSGISFPTEWREAWREWLAQLDCLGDDACRFEFLKVLHLDTDQGGLEELDTELLSRLRRALGVTEEQAAELLSCLYAALRKWTTSLRKDDAITSEDIWKELGADEATVGVHALPPPAPFFPSRIGFLEQIGAALRGASRPIIFMTGEPGCGKTSIVSALANRRDPIIDLRYHAYRPITPDMTELSLDTGETATAEVLWGDLLNQLRRHLTGRLAHHRVPLRISYLSIEDRRCEVLRLASALAGERGRRVVIAIDGIDHAARANRPDRLPFLDSLPGPDEVPDDVRLFVVGQPPEAWPAYPYWLREACNAVETYRVPPVDYEDILTLVADRILSVGPDVHEALARVIADVTEHNTLSVVFAVEEAAERPEPGKLHEHLRHRALAGSLRGYYDGIWGNATAFLPQQLFVRERIAACVAVAREYLTGKLLSNLFTDDSVSPHDWNEVLRNLRPLLVEDERGFRVMHNDVRVHLTLHAGADQSRIREISRLFLRYYEGDSCTPEARHSHLFEFARLAGELKKASAAYTPLWVAEAAALDRPMEELFQQAKLALQGLEETADWDLIHAVVRGVDTLQQLDRSDGWVGRSRPAHQAAPVLASECGVLQRDLWDGETLSRMFTEAQLIADTEAARARSMILRWLEGINPVSFVRTLNANYTRRFPDTRGGIRLDNSTRTALESWGELAHQLGIHPAEFIDDEQVEPDEGDPTDRHDAGVEKEHRGARNDDAGDHVGPRDDDESRYAWSYFAAGWLRSATRRSSGLSWARGVRIAFDLGCLQSDVAAALDELTSRGLWLEATYLLRCIRPEANLIPALRARCMVLAILSRHHPTTTRWTRQNIDKPVGQRGYSGTTDEDLLAVCAFAFVRAWKKPTEQTSSIRDTFLYTYFEGSRDSRTRQNVAVLIRASAIAGRIWRTCASAPRRSLAGAEATDAAQSLKTLLNPDSTHSLSIPLGYMSIAGRIFRLMLAGLAADAGFRPRLFSIVKDHAFSFPVGETVEPTWQLLRDENEHGILSQWWEHWCGDHGRAWSLSVSKRDSTVRTLADLARENGWIEQANAALRRLGWGRVGYSGDKDYSFGDTLAWFRRLAERDASAWRNLGMRLLAVSVYAFDVGDNRLWSEVRMAIADAMAHEGISAARSLAEAKSTGKSIEWIEWDSSMFFHWLIQCTGRDDLSREDLLYIWCLGIGVMWWEYDRDYADLASLRDGIIERSRIAGYEDIEADLERLGPLEFAAPDPTDRRDPPRSIEDLNDGKADDEVDADRFVRKVCDAANSGKASNNELIQAARLFESCSPDLRRDPGVAMTLLTRFLASRDREFFPWTYDGAQRIVAKLAPYVEDADRLEVAHDVVRAGVAQSDYYLFFGAVENLAILCRYRGKTIPTEDVRRFAERKVEMHWDWSQGFGHMPSINCPILSVPAEPDTNWAKFAVDVLSDLLCSENPHTVAAALRGLYSLVELEYPIPLVVARLAESEDKRIRYWWLLLCERLGLEHPHLRSVVEQSITNLLDDTSLPVSVQAWVTLTRLRQRGAGRLPEWPFPRPSSAPPPTTPNGQKLVFSKANQIGGVQLTSGVRSVLSTIRRVCILTGDARDLESRVVARGWDPPPPRKPARRRGNATAILFGDHSAHDVLDDELYRDLCAGRFRGVPPVRIAQAILPSDDPFIILRTAPLHQGGPWPTGDSWQMKDEEPRGILRDRLRQILLEDGIEESEVVVGGAISSFDSKTDYEIIHTLVWMAAPAELNADWHRSSPSARTFQYVFDRAYEVNDDDSVRPFTYLAGGTHQFTSGGLRVLPGRLWHALGWRPTAKDGSALRWETPSGAAIRFEAIQGPPSSEAQDAHHRQPRLHRWIASKAVIAEAEESLGGVVAPRLHFGEFPYRDP